MRWFVSIFIPLILLLSSPVLAQPTEPDTIDLYRLPEGQRCEVGGETFQCFDLDEYLVLLEMDNDLRLYDVAVPLLHEQLFVAEHIAIALQHALDAANQQVSILAEENTRLFDKWSTENRLRLEAENRPMLGSWLAWGLSAAEAVAILILSVVVAGR